MDVSIVTHTHWDREWYQTFQQFRYQLVQLIDQVLDILQEEDDYRYFMLDGQTILLEDYLELRPEREPELRELVQSSRLLIGPWHVLPDEFLVSGESLVRNLMLGDSVASRFGERMPIGYTPDPFGQISQLPQILRGVDIDTAVFRRGLAEEQTLLWWESPDGSRVFSVYLRDSYDNAAWLPLDSELFPRALVRLAKRIGAHTPAPHVLLMHGTDHMFPTPRLPAMLEIADQTLPEINVHHSTLPAYVADVRARLDSDLPTVSGELRNPRRHHLLPGVWSARMWIKQRNTTVQTALERYAEPLTAFSGAGGGPARRAHLWNAWRHLLENHPHDSICGCSIDQTHEEMKPRFDQAEQLADLVAYEGLETLARQVDVQPLLDETTAPEWPAATHVDASAPVPAGWTVTVYNPVARTVTSPVEVEVPAVPRGYTYRLFDAEGRTVEWELVEDPASESVTWTVSAAESPALLDELQRSEANGRAVEWSAVVRRNNRTELWLEWGERDTIRHARFVERVRTHLQQHPADAVTVHAWSGGRARVRFLAVDVPGTGLQSYLIRPVLGEPAPTAATTRSTSTVENDLFRLTAGADGTLTLVDKRTGRKFSGLNRFEDRGDRGDEYNFCPPENDRQIDTPTEVSDVTAVDAGMHGKYLEVRLRYDVPAALSEDRRGRQDELVPVSIVTRAWLRPGVPRVDFETIIENGAEDHRLRVRFPTGVSANETLAENAFDLVARGFDRPNDTEDWIEQPEPTQPQHAFILVEGQDGGALLANQGLPEVEAIHAADDTVTFALTLLRCVGWLSRTDFPCRTGPAGPHVATPGAQMPGEWTFNYAFVPYGHETSRWEAIAEAHSFNAPPIAAAVPAEPGGTYDLRQSLLDVTPNGFLLTAIKPAEDGYGVIVRGFNATEAPLDVTIRPHWHITQAQTVNLLERPQEQLDIYNGSVQVRTRSKQIVSIRLE